MPNLVSTVYHLYYEFEYDSEELALLERMLKKLGLAYDTHDLGNRTSIEVETNDQTQVDLLSLISREQFFWKT